MSKRTQALCTPERKAEVKRNRSLGSRFIRFIPSTEYGEFLSRTKASLYRYDEQGRRIA